MKNSIMHPFKFRTAIAQDATSIVGLVQSAYRGEYSRNGWTTEADFLDGTRTDSHEVSEIIRTPDNIILLCVNDSHLLASVHLQKQENAACLGMFAVSPIMQNTGIGKTLLSEAEDTARQRWQSQRMQMTVITLRKELIEWYERRGYRRTGITRPFPYGIARYGIPKRDDLVLEILDKAL